MPIFSLAWRIFLFLLCDVRSYALCVGLLLLLLLLLLLPLLLLNIFGLPRSSSMWVRADPFVEMENRSVSFVMSADARCVLVCCCCIHLAYQAAAAAAAVCARALILSMKWAIVSCYRSNISSSLQLLYSFG